MKKKKKGQARLLRTWRKNSTILSRHISLFYDYRDFISRSFSPIHESLDSTTPPR